MEKQHDFYPLLLYMIAFGMFNALTAGIAAIVVLLVKVSGEVIFSAFLIANYVPVVFYLVLGLSNVKDIVNKNMKKVIISSGIAAFFIILAISIYFSYKVLYLKDFELFNYFVPYVLNGICTSVYFYLSEEIIVPNYE